MKKHLFLFLLILSFQLSQAQTSVKGDEMPEIVQKELPLKGKVKSCREQVFETSNLKDTFVLGKDVSFRYGKGLTQFDAGGRKIQCMYFDADGAGVSLKKDYIWQKGRLSRILYFRVDTLRKREDKVEDYEYEYPAKDRITLKKMIFPLYSRDTVIKNYTYQLDEKGRIIRMEGEFSGRPGKVSFKVSYNEQDSSVTIQGVKYRLNKYHLVKWQSFTENPIMKYYYNSKGDCIKEEKYDSMTGDLDEVKTHSYTYDSHGNWIEKITYRKELEGKPRPYLFSRRVIVYY